MQNLRDKLLKAGLVSEEAARKSTKEASAGANASPKTRAAPPAHKPAPTIPRLPPLALPGTKAFQRLEALKQQEEDKRLRDLVTSAQVPVEPGEHAFHFITRKGKLRRLNLSEAQAKQLESGALAVVERPEPAMIEHSLVPAATAEAIFVWSPKSVRFFNKEGSPIGFSKPEGD